MLASGGMWPSCTEPCFSASFSAAADAVSTAQCVASTLRKDSGGYHAAHPIWAIALGCEVSHARELVYADGVDLTNLATAVPVGLTCRLCERMDCEQRAFPPLHHPIKLDVNVRGANFYAPPDRDERR